VVPRPVAVDMAEIVHAAAARHQPLAQLHKLDLRVSVRPGSVRADPVLLARILDNLLSNAIRYTRSGGILVACRRRGGRGVIEVWDTGIGIAPEHQQAIFEEFFQVANPERDRAKGAGLGLAVVRKTAKLIGAGLTVSSRQGRGTRFRLELPLAEEMAEAS
jgi:signal transduction histidine kinase